MIAKNKNTLLSTPFTGTKTSSQSVEQRLHERTFFHDIINTTGGLQGFAEMLNDADADEIEEYKELIIQLSSKLLDEVKAYQQFTAAEQNELEAITEELSSEDFLRHIVESFKQKEVGMVFQIEIASSNEDMVMVADRNLLQRILFNLLKNALEAGDYEKPVTVGCTMVGGYVQFQVHNPEYIAEEVQRRVFEKSFSTKGRGRGYGAYTIKSLAEDYLNGFVTFTSTPETGTTFNVTIPSDENNQNIASTRLIKVLAMAV